MSDFARSDNEIARRGVTDMIWLSFGCRSEGGRLGQLHRLDTIFTPSANL
jgi:hypothetical protein